MRGQALSALCCTRAQACVGPLAKTPKRKSLHQQAQEHAATAAAQQQQEQQRQAPKRHKQAAAAGAPAAAPPAAMVSPPAAAAAAICHSQVQLSPLAFAQQTQVWQLALRALARAQNER